MARQAHLESCSFPSTRWSLIFSARAEDSLARPAALEELLRLYLPPLRSYLLYRLRIEPNRAEDLLQGFVARQVLERELLTKADAGKGRFRSFLLKSVQNYVFKELGRSEPEEVHFDLDPSVSKMSDVFEIEWARQLLQEALGRMQRDCRRDGLIARWDLFACRVVLPTLTGRTSPTYKDLIERFDFRSPEQASNALVTAKRQFERTIRAVIADMENVASDTEIDAEIADLCRTLQNAGPLDVDWDHMLIAGPLGGGRDRLSAVDESNPGEMACLMSVRGTPEGNWQPAELTDLLRHCLEMPVRKYLGIDTAPAPRSHSGAYMLLEEDAASMPLGELFRMAAPPLRFLVAVKRHARRLTRPLASDMPAAVHRTLYFGCIAAAMVRHSERISTSKSDVLRAAFEQLQSETWIHDWLRGLLCDALPCLSGKPRR